MTTVRSGHAVIMQIELDGWSAALPACVPEQVVAALESGDVVFLPRLRFEVLDGERHLFSPAIVGSSKNVAFNPATGALGGATADEADRRTLAAMIGRFAAGADALVRALCSAYGSQLKQGRTSFRPVEIAGRATSWRKDDTRLHIDAFPSMPVHGDRILRVFTNVNPEGRPRSWRVGERFDGVAARFAPQLRVPAPGVPWLLHAVRITKSQRTAYDALMLQLHDRMKADEAYQKTSPQLAVDFPAGSTWLTFTDQVPHAATAGQYQL